MYREGGVGSSDSMEEMEEEEEEEEEFLPDSVSQLLVLDLRAEEV